MEKKAAGVIYQHHLGYLDHLGPLCSLFKIPLIVSEEDIYQIAKKYYPKLKVHLLTDYVSFCKVVASAYSTIISCQFLYSDSLVYSMLQSYNKDLKLVWLPHGHSDKGWKSKIFTALKDEKTTLVYGQKMLDAFKKQNVLNKIPKKCIIGNYRQHYYEQNYNFYKKVFKNEIANKLDPAKKTIFYAPTWKDYEDNSSFEAITQTLIDGLIDFNLIIKPHPNTCLKMKIEIERLEDLSQNKNIYFVKDFSNIYSILDFCDIYLGDMSSIGYDFLYFNKPMFFLNNNNRSKKDPGLFLFRSGIEIKPDQYPNIYQIIKKNIPLDSRFTKVRKKIYGDTFGKVPDFKILLQDIASY